MRAETEAARLALDEALEGAEGQVPCRYDPDLWHAASADDRHAAAAACRRCPLIDPCLVYAVAHGAQWGTWGGVDMQKVPDRRRAQRQVRAARRATATTTEETR